jgi:hypothetical protein
VRLDVSVFRHARDNRPQRLATSWDKLAARLCTAPVRRVEQKLDLPAWCPAVWPEGVTRSALTVDAVSCMVLDYDDGTTIDQAHARWRDWPHVIHTSWSHQHAHHKFRVVLPLEEPVGRDLWPRAWAWAAGYSGLTIDPKCKDPGRIYFLPAVPRSDAPWDCIRWEEPSRCLALYERDLPELPLPPPLPPPPPPGVGGRRGDPDPITDDPDARRRVGLALGGRVVERADGAVIRGVTCPSCGRPSVWWPLSPARKRKAECSHRNTCGWTGYPDQLAARS